jgi:hypothetical protein
MNKHSLIKRQKIITASRKTLYANNYYNERRGSNYVPIDNKEVKEFEDFFEFEEDLSGFKAAKDVALSSPRAEELLASNSNKVDGIILEELYDPNHDPKGLVLDIQDTGLDVNLCQFVTPNGQCHKRKPQYGNYCKEHVAHTLNKK